MDFRKAITVSSVLDYKEKVKACKTLGLNYCLDGKLREFTYDIFNEEGMEKPSLVGSFSSLTEEIHYLKTYSNFKEEDIKFKHIRANDDPYLPKEDIIELDVLVWNKRFFIIEDAELIIS